MKTWNEEQEGIETNSKRTLMDELENKNAQLSDAERQIKELSQIVFAEVSQLPQSLPSAPVSSPLHEASPASKPSLPSTSPAEGSRSSFFLFRLPANEILPPPPSPHPFYVSPCNSWPVPPFPRLTNKRGHQLVGSNQRGQRFGLAGR